MTTTGADLSFVHLGITIEHLPSSIDVFGFRIAFYGIIIGCGMLAGIWLAMQDARRRGQDPDLYLDFALYAIIFSIIGEELGFIGCTIIIILFAVFIWRGILIAMKAPDMFGSLIAVGITALVGIQVIINIAVVTSSMPATGMPLPFFSYRRNSIIYITM